MKNLLKQILVVFSGSRYEKWILYVGILMSRKTPTKTTNPTEEKDFVEDPHVIGRINFPIDVVITYVESVQVLENDHYKKLSSAGKIAQNRIRSWGEIRHCILGITKNMPWVENIWIVTNDAQKLDGTFAGGGAHLKVISHRDFIPEEYLPTFNSHVIVSHLHRIEGLSEHFLYINDDVFVLQPSAKRDFFTSHGQAVIRFTRTVVSDSTNDTLLISARQRTIDLAKNLDLQYSRRLLQHGPHPLKKSILKEMWKVAYIELTLTSLSKVREHTDIVPEWLHNSIAFTSGAAIEGPKRTYKYIAINKKNILLDLLQIIIRPSPTILCLNDVEIGETCEIDEIVRNRIAIVLNHLLPVSADSRIDQKLRVTND